MNVNPGEPRKCRQSPSLSSEGCSESHKGLAIIRLPPINSSTFEVAVVCGRIGAVAQHPSAYRIGTEDALAPASAKTYHSATYKVRGSYVKL
jgi:hypothetical protein